MARVKWIAKRKSGLKAANKPKPKKIAPYGNLKITPQRYRYNLREYIDGLKISHNKDNFSDLVSLVDDAHLHFRLLKWRKDQRVGPITRYPSLAKLDPAKRHWIYIRQQLEELESPFDGLTPNHFVREDHELPIPLEQYQENLSRFVNGVAKNRDKSLRDLAVDAGYPGYRQSLSNWSRGAVRQPINEYAFLSKITGISWAKIRQQIEELPDRTTGLDLELIELLDKDPADWEI